MPLEPYQRGKTWWVRGRIEYDGQPVTDYFRSSTGASSEAGARAWISEETERQVRRYLLGDEASLTFADAVLLYPAKPAEAKFLLKVLPELGHLPVKKITPQQVRDLGSKLYPSAATDTWKRQVITPVSAVINHAHDLGKCPPIRIRGYSSQQRIDQDKLRGKQSRLPKNAGSWPWIRSVQAHSNVYVSAGLEFMFETGCRIGQLVEIRPKDLDLMKRRVWLQAQKGHDAQWVAISTEMVVTLANLKPRRPHNRRDGYRLDARVFGYSNRSGFTSALKTACKAAKVEYLSPHQAGRHGFYTELRVRQGVDSLSAARAGRWSNAALPDRVYARVEMSDSEAREHIRSTGSVARSRTQ
ncbi:site-specific integrase [Pelagovum pacificum]|uniref:Site-specific integrase n=1 Tax=Pelagovum pacificum TaxID=2588711 RepID=A0A5C5GFH9_9RHOB|nr:site-specific integrase [Pelagovum pacificum]QQA43927.1 site-specific integrase [Pelagovum pacificum]TNY32944.1 site-specific integrase [Pelagovum pacificum]